MTNFYLPQDATVNYFPQTKREKVNANMEAIRTLKRLGDSPASYEDQVILSKYVGWGGLANDFFDTATPSFADERDELQKLVTEDEYNAMRASSLTAYYTDPGICRAMWKKAISDGVTKGNILDPSMGTGMFFMTMPEELRDTTSLWGVELDSISGAIAQKLFPDAHIFVKGFQDVEFETDEDDIEQGAGFDLVITNIPFGSTKIYDAETDKSDSIHDYFVKKSLKLLRNYGELAIISSTYLVDKRVKSSLPEICKQATFLGGVRLPSKSFKRLAGTTVTTDVLFFEKDVNGDIVGFNDEVLAPVEESSFPASNGRGELPLTINPFFTKGYGTMRSRVLGTIRVKSFHGTSIEVQYDADEKSMLDDLAFKLESTQVVAQADGISSNWGRPIKAKKEELSVVGDDAAENADNLAHDDEWRNVMLSIPAFEFGMYKGDVYYRDVKAVLKNSSMNAIELWYNNAGDFVEYGNGATKSVIDAYKAQKDSLISIARADKPSQRGKHEGLWKRTAFFAMPYKKTELARIKGMIAIKEAYRHLIDLQTGRARSKEVYKAVLGLKQDPSAQYEDVTGAIQYLNDVYDSFKSSYGCLNDRVNSRLFRDDNSAILVESLEEQEVLDDGTTRFVKGPAFDKPMIAQAKEKSRVHSAHDALLLSLSENRGVDFEFMSAVYDNHSKEEIVDELGDEIVIDPEYYMETGEIRYVDRDTFLSGDILTKINLVKEILAQIEA